MWQVKCIHKKRQMSRDELSHTKLKLLVQVTLGNSQQAFNLINTLCQHTSPEAQFNGTLWVKLFLIPFNVWLKVTLCENVADSDGAHVERFSWITT